MIYCNICRKNLNLTNDSIYYTIGFKENEFYCCELCFEKKSFAGFKEEFIATSQFYSSSFSCCCFMCHKTISNDNQTKLFYRLKSEYVISPDCRAIPFHKSCFMEFSGQFIPFFVV